MRSLIYDTETDSAKPTEATLLQLTAKLFEHEDDKAHITTSGRLLIKPIATISVIVDAGVDVPSGAFNVHGISRARTEEVGIDPKIVAETFAELFAITDLGVCHNANYDTKVMTKFLKEQGIDDIDIFSKEAYCTMKTLKPVMRLTPKVYGDFKNPRLDEAHQYLFGRGFEGAHDSEADVDATTRVYFAARALQKNLEIPLDEGTS